MKKSKNLEKRGGVLQETKWERRLELGFVVFLASCAGFFVARFMWVLFMWSLEV